jgi:trehalose 6-phosphate phosphatase
MVETPPEIINELKKMQILNRIQIIIISGRMMSEIKQRIPLEHISYVADHGSHIELNDGTKKIWEPPESSLRLIDKIKNTIQSRYQSQNGFFIEDKSSSVAFHYRNVLSDEKQFLIHNIQQIILRMNIKKELNVIQGAQVIEIRSTTMNKGLAVQYIQKHFSFDHSLPIYIGDDTTDEDAFNVIGSEGVTVFVRNDSERVSHAMYWIASQKEVVEILRFLSDSL